MTTKNRKTFMTNTHAALLALVLREKLYLSHAPQIIDRAHMAIVELAWGFMEHDVSPTMSELIALDDHGVKIESPGKTEPVKKWLFRVNFDIPDESVHPRTLSTFGITGQFPVYLDTGCWRAFFTPNDVPRLRDGSMLIHRLESAHNPTWALYYILTDLLTRFEEP